VSTFCCKNCGGVAEVPDCVLDDATAQVQSMTGFRVTSHRVVFGGCAVDRSPSTQSRSPGVLVE
jgi:Fe2+ or Zn2+ uptake regulation protein